MTKAMLAMCALFAASMGTASAQEKVLLPAKVEVRAMSGASETLKWAVERTAKELTAVHNLNASKSTAVKQPFAGSSGMAQVLLGVATKSETLAKWCRANGVKDVDRSAGSNAFRVTVLANPLRVVILGSDDIGAWYGACQWLNSLIGLKPGPAETFIGETGGAPEMDIRFTRGLASAKNNQTFEDQKAMLDWWARWRLNTITVGDADPRFIAEAHKRGMRLLIRLGVRNLCASDDKAVADLADSFNDFLKAGGDGLSCLWDDLPNERCRGHCDRCRAKFGEMSLPKEIVHILEALCDVTAKYPEKKYLVWCPSHYSKSRYKQLSDEDFFRVIGSSAKVREQTYMYHCEFDPAYTDFLDRSGTKQRVFWYNGLRSIYYMLTTHVPSPKALKKLDIPGFGGGDFARFETGWFTGVNWHDDGTIAYATPRIWQHLISLSNRYQGFYLCGSTGAYHNALIGLYGFAPTRFTQAGADRLIFGSIFGAGSAPIARRWSDDYNYLQAYLAKRAAQPLSEADHAQAVELIEALHRDRLEVERIAARKQTVLPRHFVDAQLAYLRDGDEALRGILERIMNPLREP